MSGQQVDISNRIAGLGHRVLFGERIAREDAHWLFGLARAADIYDLMAWANRVREHFKGNRIQLCSIVNVKASGCAEDCKFCAQSAVYPTEAPRYDFIGADQIQAAAKEAKSNGVADFGIVAAWKGLAEGPLLDAVCDRIADLARRGQVKPHASLGMIKNRRVAERLRESGLTCYNHNIETSERFFPQVCTTHSYQDRLETIGYVKQAGIKVCCGGIIGMGESLEDRCDIAFALRELDVDVVPMNFLNPIPGTPFENVMPLQPMEILKTIACFRIILPKQEIMIAGGRAVNLRDLQAMIFMAGASAMMVGNYLTTLNQPVEKDLQMLRDLGLETRAEIGMKANNGRQQAAACASGCCALCQ